MGNRQQGDFDAAIKKELGVTDWTKVDFSRNLELKREWDQLVASFTVSPNVESGIVKEDRNEELIREIGTSHGYIWESVYTEAQTYATLAFDDLVFRWSAYTMNGETDSGDFTKIIELSGSWTAIDSQTAEGVIELDRLPITWTFNSDYGTLTNNKGVVFHRVLVK